MKYNPMRASSYLPLPEKLKAKQWCLNIQSIEKKWFLCPILVLLYPVQHRNHPNRVSKYQGYEHESNMSGIQYPVGIKDIGKFKHQNNISVNVYGHQNKKIFPLRNNDNNKRYFCQCCLHGSTCEEVLKNHMERCKLYGAQRIKLLEAGDKKGCDKEKLKKTEFQLRLPLVIYAEFERVLCKQDSCEPSSSKSFIAEYQHHIPCGSCICVKFSGGKYFEPLQVNVVKDAAKKFLDQVLAAATICR